MLLLLLPLLHPLTFCASALSALATAAKASSPSRASAMVERAMLLLARYSDWLLELHYEDCKETIEG